MDIIPFKYKAPILPDHSEEGYMNNWTKRLYADDNPNKHIADYLNYYLGMKQPGFAVLLDGTWGCGKTHFIQHYLKYGQEDYPPDCIYVSLYGIRSFDHLDAILYAQLHPKMGGKNARIASSIMNSIVKAVIDVDVKKELEESDEQGRLASQIVDIVSSQFGEIDSKVIVFDDFERCPMDPWEVLGYINILVEHIGTRVIVCANEKEVDMGALKDGNQDKKTEYERIKEKTIAKRFVVQPFFSEFLDHLLSNYPESNEKLVQFLQSRSEVLLDIIQTSGQPNLRILKHALSEFTPLFEYTSNLPEYDDVGHWLICEAVLKFYLALALEIQTGNISKNDFKVLNNDDVGFREAILPSFAYDRSVPREERKPIDEAMRKYFPEFSTYYIAPRIMFKILEGVQYTEQEFHEQVLDGEFIKYNLQYVPVELFRRSRNLREYSDTELDEHIDELEQGMAQGLLQHPMDYLLSANMLLLFRVWGIKQYSDEEITEKCISGIKSSSMDKKHVIGFKYQQGQHDSWRGLGFEFRRESAFIEVSTFLNDHCSSLTQDYLKEYATRLLGRMAEGWDIYEQTLEEDATDEMKYNRLPVHAYIDPKDYFEEILRWSNRDLHQLYFFVRQKGENLNYRQDREIGFWKSLGELLSQHIVDTEETKMSSVIIREIAEEINKLPESRNDEA